MIRAFQTGANIAHQRAALDQQAQITNLELMQRAEDARQKSLENQQKLQVERAYRNIQTSLAARKLDEVEAVNKQKAQVAGKVVLARERAKARANQLVAGGMDRTQAERQSLLENWNELGLTANQLRIMTNPPRQGKESPAKLTPRAKAEAQEDMAGLNEEIKDAEKRLRDPNTPDADKKLIGPKLEELKKRRTDARAKLGGEGLESQAQTETPTPAQVVAPRRGRTNLPDWRENVMGPGVIAPEMPEAPPTSQVANAGQVQPSGLRVQTFDQNPIESGAITVPKTAESATPSLPQAPVDKKQRKVGTTYQTPKGPRVWQEDDKGGYWTAVGGDQGGSNAGDTGE